jgi:hypothetical protein
VLNGVKPRITAFDKQAISISKKTNDPVKSIKIEKHRWLFNWLYFEIIRAY